MAVSKPQRSENVMTLNIIFAFIVMIALIAFVSGILTGFYFSERQHEDDHHRRWYDKKLEEQK